MMKMDEYELELLEAVEKTSAFSRVENFEDELDEAKRAARNFLKKTKNINIRIPEFDMLMLKRKSAELNIPYQTILSSLIHQYVTDKIKPTM
jgi:predicted DNA binding CopG/RHH family protein